MPWQGLTSRPYVRSYWEPGVHELRCFSWGLMCMQVQEPSSQQNLIFDEVTLGDSMPSEAVARALALLAKWALRRAERTAEPGEVITEEANSLVVK